MNKWGQSKVGCVFDSHHGQYIYGYIVDLAVDNGWPISDDDDISRRWAYNSEVDYDTQQMCWDHLISQGGIADMAEKWLNENVASEGYHFGWCDGEYFFQSDEWWSEDE